MKKNAFQKRISVYAHWEKFKTPQLIGQLYATPSKGREIFSFEYTKEWLKLQERIVLDPDLSLFKGQQYLNDDKSNFGVFLDSSPDRWGRLLMRRREAALARGEKREEKSLVESDYLLGVYDGHRMGGIRFKLDEKGPFLSNNKRLATPHWTSLRELEHASLQLERDDSVNDPEYLKWLEMLFAPGASLGGARPKASVLGEHNQLWIAKFPSRKDDSDTGAWEMVAHELALKAGLDVAHGQIRQFNSPYHTYLTKRFDRNEKGERLHFSSAMTMLGYQDGDDHTEGVSYLEITEFLMRHGARVNADLEELWRRIVFSICISNCDDHLRNHGFLLSSKGWILSPAYDINPVPMATGLKLNITENDNTMELELALQVIEYFRIGRKRAEDIIAKVKQAVSEWERVAHALEIPRNEREFMRRAFKCQ